MRNDVTVATDSFLKSHSYQCSDFNNVVVRPFPKKSNLDPNILIKHRPVSSL